MLLEVTPAWPAETCSNHVPSRSPALTAGVVVPPTSCYTCAVPVMGASCMQIATLVRLIGDQDIHGYHSPHQGDTSMFAGTDARCGGVRLASRVPRFHFNSLVIDFGIDCGPRNCRRICVSDPTRDCEPNSRSERNSLRREWWCGSSTRTAERPVLQ